MHTCTQAHVYIYIHTIHKHMCAHTHADTHTQLPWCTPARSPSYNLFVVEEGKVATLPPYSSKKQRLSSPIELLDMPRVLCLWNNF